MDFGVAVGLDRWGGSSHSASTFAPCPSSDPLTHHKRYGSGFLKQETSGASTIDEDDWRSSKLPKTVHDSNTNDSASKAMLLRSNTSLFSSDGHQHQQMLSFSCPKSEHQNATFPNYLNHPFSAYSRNSSNTGYCNGGVLNGGNMLTGVRGPFTPSQWMELEHQALIYKYITANVPVPSNLLIPIRKAFASAGFSTFAGGLLRPNALGWGSFHLGFSSNNDPEPGRCRRTDGKKWRCSRDAVADQKYCERHMNRGRHRSRKPVEGQAGHAAGAANSAKLMPAASPSSASVVAAIAQQQLNNLQPGASAAANLSASNRMYTNKEEVVGERMQDSSALSMISPTIDAKSKQNPFFNQKLQNPFEQSSRNEFGFVSSDSLLNPSNKSSSLINCRSFGSSQDLSDRDSKAQHHSLRQFMDEWPKNQTDRASISWPDLDMQSDRTQLSISIPMAPPSGYMSSTSSPNYHEKVTLSPLRLSREFDPIQMELGVGINESSSRQANWIPISWETSMGGPLGEVLHNNNSTMESKNSSSALNLMTEGWDNSPSLGSSPTGVLQKTAFGSLSNSSAGSSPRAESRTHEGGASLCNDLGTTLPNSASLPT